MLIGYKLFGNEALLQMIFFATMAPVSWKPTEKIPQNLCPLCDKQVITRGLGQLRISYTCVFKVVPKLPESQSDQGNFEITREINYPRAHGITFNSCCTL